MISDVLAETVSNLDHYLDNSNYDDTYTGEERERIVKLRNEAETVRDILDEPPRPAALN